MFIFLFSRFATCKYYIYFYSINKKKSIYLYSTIISIFMYSNIAFGEIVSFQKEKVSLSLSMDVGGVGIYLPNTNFGGGSYVIHKNNRITKNSNTTYGELYAYPVLDGTWQTPWHFDILGQISTVASTTLGDGDGMSISQTAGNKKGINIEDANLGVRFPFSINNTEQSISIIGGKQRFAIDDGFLLGKGTYNSNSGAWWYAPRFAFNGPGTIKYEGQSSRADIFMLENNSDNSYNHNNDWPKTKFIGFDISLFKKKQGAKNGADYKNRSAYVTMTYIHVRDADSSSHYDDNIRGNRNGMNIVGLSFGGVFVPINWLNINKNFTFYGNFVGQQNSHGNNQYRSTEAYGMYIEPGYTFSNLSWKPHIFYRYTRFSGNKNPNGTVKRSYDPFFLIDGKRYTYGGYWPGEIVGMYMVGLSNLQIQQFDITAVPPVHFFTKNDSLTLGVHFYNLSLIHPTGAGFKRGSSHHISNEIDFSGEYNLDENTSFSLLGGVAFSGPVAKKLAINNAPKYVSPNQIGSTSGVLEAYFYKHF